MTTTLTIGALRRAYLEGATTPSELLLGLSQRLDAPDQAGVWISTISPERLAETCAALEADPGARDLPLYGIPFSVKDNIDVAGFDTTAACPAFAYPAKSSATVVARAEAAGAICLGKTNLDQFATGLVGVRSPYGVPANPFNRDYIPGGSSSGAAVSVSTGMVAFAFGTDTGGSGRVPASYNGIYGWKPAPGEWSRQGLVYACRSFDTATVFTAALDDAQTVDAVVRGFDPKDPFSQVFASETVGSPRIAMVPAEVIRPDLDADVAPLYAEAEDRLARLAPVTPADLSEFQSINDLMFFGPMLAERDVSVGEFIASNLDKCHPVVGPMVQSSRKFSAADAYRAQYRVVETKARTAALWSRADVLAVPTVGHLVTRAMCEDDPLGPNFKNGTYTNFANPLGLFGLAVPIGRAAMGVPWGIMLYANPQRRDGAVRIARLLSSAGG